MDRDALNAFHNLNSHNRQNPGLQALIPFSMAGKQRLAAKIMEFPVQMPWRFLLLRIVGPAARLFSRCCASVCYPS